METVFPFGFPFATALYLTLYILTLAVHLVFVSYVIGGTAYIAARRLIRPNELRLQHDTTCESQFRDWLPAALSMAITAGVAPILFVQILYQHSFYTAHLLMFERWFAVLPLLIVGFYLLYVLRSGWFDRLPRFARCLVAPTAMACFAYTGLCWIEGHLLATHRVEWPAFYEAESRAFYPAEFWPRTMLWIGTFAFVAPVMVGWQLRVARRDAYYGNDREARTLSIVAMAGIILSVLSSLWYHETIDTVSQELAFSQPTLPYLYLAIAGLVIQCVLWVRIGLTRRLYRGTLTACTIGVAVTLIGELVLRETLRLSRVDWRSLVGQHTDSLRTGGAVIFTILLLLNAAMIAWCIRLGFRASVANRPAQPME